MWLSHDSFWPNSDWALFLERSLFIIFRNNCRHSSSLGTIVVIYRHEGQAEAYLQPNQTSRMKLFFKNSERPVFSKKPNVYIWLGSKNVCGRYWQEKLIVKKKLKLINFTLKMLEKKCYSNQRQVEHLQLSFLVK